MNRPVSLMRNEDYATPVDAPAYGPLPTVYRGVEFLTVYFTVEPRSIAPLLPAPFEPGEDGLCAALAIRVPFSSSYGPFNEMGVVVAAKFRGEKCFFLPALYLDNDSAIAAGREIYGSPKKRAEISMEQRGDLCVASCARHGVPIMTMTARIHAPAKLEEFPSVFPVYNLKLIPSIDGPRPAVKQITCTGVDQPVVHWSYRCAGAVELHPTAVTGCGWLKVKETIAACRYMMDYEQGYGRVVYDYLTAK
jgi:acetoacetate decarboxylase